MRNTIILSVVLFVAVVAAGLYYFRDLDGEHNKAAKPLRYLPNNTLLIAAIGNNEATDNIFKDFEIFEALLGQQAIDEMSQFKAQLLRNEALKKHVVDSEIYISFHKEGNDLETILTVPTSTALSAAELPTVLNGISKQYKISNTDTLGNKLYQLHYGAKDSSLYAIYYNHVFFASKSSNLLTKILDKHSKHLPDSQIDFFLKGDSRNTALSIYFPHQQYDSIVALSQRRKSGAFLDLFRNMQGQSVWNINYKQDALMLTGESALDQYSENFASLFKNQQKMTQSMYAYFPSSTSVYVACSISDRPRYQKDLRALFKRRKEKIAEEIDTTGQQEQLAALLGNEIALIETNNSSLIGFIKLQERDSFSALAKQWLDTPSDSIFRFNTSGLLYKQYGDIFTHFTRPYLIRIDDVLVISNSTRTLSDYRDAYAKRDFLTGTLGFKNFEKLQGNEANLTLFVHTKNANSKILNALSTPFQKNFRDSKNYGYQDFFSWSMQLSGNSGKFISQLYAIYKSKNALGVTPEWTYRLENKALTKPYVFEHSDSSQFILLQELDHTLHAISPSGEKLWSNVLAGRVVGDLQQLEDRSIVLVTDRNILYRFDTDGSNLKGFYTEISAQPIAQPTLVDLKGHKVFIIVSQHKVHAVNLDGSPLSDWQSPEFEDELIGPALAQGDQLAVGTRKGKIQLLGSHGQKLRELKVKSNISVTNPIGVLQSTAPVPEFLVIDTAGWLYRVPFEGAAKPMRVAQGSSDSFSDFININTTSLAELVTVDKSLLRVFEITDSTRLLFEHNFTKEISDSPQYFPVSQGSGLQIGVASRATNLLYLFQPDGLVVEGFPVEGLPLFHYGRIHYNGEVYLLCMRRDHKLYAFKHQKTL